MTHQTDLAKCEIKKICERNQIRNLFHFTRIANLRSIWRRGLIARSEIERRPNTMNVVFNDCNRRDGYRNAICLSIGFPNEYLFRQYRLRATGEKWMVLEIDLSVLWELDCAFCPRNASSAAVRQMQIAELTTPEAFDRLFGGYRITLPKDPQAEVLAFGRIDWTKYLKRIHFSCGEDMTKAKHHTEPTMPPFLITPEYFERRPETLR